jgi:MerR family transcriptional regulator, light-induced transcriptional regulator
MTIAQASELLGVPVPTIRSWERRYAFPTPARTDGKHRRYSTEELESLRALRDEITRGSRAREAVAKVRSAADASPVRNEFLDRFTAAAASLDTDGMRLTLDQATELLGVTRAIDEVALPGMRDLGDRWKAGSCDVATEHLATQTVRQWFARLSALTPPPFKRRPLVLACGPTELHTVGLEAFAVVLARHGWNCRVLGAMTPVASLATAVRDSRAGGAVVSAQRSVGRRGAVEALRAVRAIPGVELFYGGNAFSTARARETVPGVYLGDDLERAATLVGSRVR